MLDAFYQISYINFLNYGTVGGFDTESIALVIMCYSRPHCVVTKQLPDSLRVR